MNTMRLTIRYLYIIVLTFVLTTSVFAQDINWDKLVEAVIQVESGGNPNAVGTSGEIGLMQVSAIVFKEYADNVGYWDAERAYGTRIERNGTQTTLLVGNNIQCLWDARCNRNIGTWYLKRLHNHYKCTTIEQILSAYNAGPSRKNNPPKSTQKYIKKVRAIYDKAIQ